MTFAHSCSLTTWCENHKDWQSRASVVISYSSLKSHKSTRMYFSSQSIAAKLRHRTDLWLQTLQDCLGQPLRNPKEEQNFTNITFLCKGNQKVAWNGLAYLATFSKLFKPRLEEEQNYTVFLPDYRAKIVLKLLDLLSTGTTIAKRKDASQLTQLAKDLVVSLKAQFTPQPVQNVFQILC